MGTNRVVGFRRGDSNTRDRDAAPGPEASVMTSPKKPGPGVTAAQRRGHWTVLVPSASNVVVSVLGGHWFTAVTFSVTVFVSLYLLFVQPRRTS